MQVILQQQPFDPGQIMNGFIGKTTSAGAAVTFTGILRSEASDPVLAMTIEHYPELAVPQIERTIGRAIERFSLLDAMVIHRHGRLLPSEAIMQVTTLAPHRAAAFEGASFLMDYLKTGAPFWKREETPSGPRWVNARCEDEASVSRWDDPSLSEIPIFSS